MMKKTFTFLTLMLIAVAGFSQTYYWVGGATGNFASVNSWNTLLDGTGTPIPAAPASTDILIFDGSNIGGVTAATGQVTPFISTSFTLLQLKFQNAADVVFNRSSSSGGLSTGTSAFILNGDGGPAHDLVIDATSSFKLTSISYPTAQNLNLLLAAGATGNIQGTVRIDDAGLAKNYLHVAVANSLFFASGSKAYVKNTFASSFAFSISGGSAVNNGVVFQNGSTLIFQGGASPFTTTAAAQPLVLAPGSTYVLEGALTSTNNFTRHTFSNVIVRNNATVIGDGAPYNIDNLTIETGSTFTLGASGGYPLSGNVLNNGTFNILAGTSNVVLVGTTAQSFSGTGTYSLGGFTVSTDAELTLNTNVTISGTATTNIEGKLNTQTYSISGTGPFNLRTAASVTSGGNLTTGAYTITIDPAVYSSAGNAANVVVGALVSGTGIPANTYITATSSSSSTITVNKPATVTTTGNSSAITIANNPATLTTSNPLGVDGSIATTGTKGLGSGTHYIFNAATVAPFGVGSNNTTGDVTFNAAATTNKTQNIGGTLTLATGVLTIRSTDTIRLTNATNIAGAPFSASKYIHTQEATGQVGVLRMDGITTAKTFPVGSSTYYLPAVVTPSSAMDFAVSVFEGVTADGTAAGAELTATEKEKIVDAVWIINRMLGAGDAQVDLAWNAALEGSLFTSYADATIGIGKHNGVDYNAGIGTASNSSNTASALFNDFSSFIINSTAAVLPLQLGNVFATIEANGIEIGWNVLAEVAILKYEVERSTDRVQFSSVGTVAASNRSNYKLLDGIPVTGIVYYRLKITGEDGSVKYSDIILVRTGNDKTISLYPNPVVQSINISGLKNNSSLRISNAAGQVLSLQRTTVSSISLDVSALRPGRYILEVLAAGERSSIHSFIKQ